MRLLQGLDLFKLVVPHLQSRVVGPHPVWATWFTNRLLLDGTEPYPDCLGHNRQPAIPEVQDSDTFYCQLVGYFESCLESQRLGIWGDRMELCLVDSDSSELFLVDSRSSWLVIIPKSKDRFVERPPMKLLQP
jgi:hypothetical protein